jgi:hypothetical protein
MAFSALSGNIAYEFVQLNVSGALIALLTLQGLPLNKQHPMKEAEFRFDWLSAHINIRLKQILYLLQKAVQQLLRKYLMTILLSHLFAQYHL